MPIPWKQGFWQMGVFRSYILQTADDGSDILWWKNIVALDYPKLDEGAMEIDCSYGKFGEPKKEIAEATGATECNFQAKEKNGMFNFTGVLNDEGTKITVWGMGNHLEEWHWLDEERLQKIKDERDDYDAPSCPHITPKPGTPGRVFWLSGPPGAGKSTTCQLLARDNSYIYYEADCTASLINPFTDVNVENPSMASFGSAPLKNVPEETARLAIATGQVFKEAFEEGGLDKWLMDEKVAPFYKMMAEDILKQKKRLGGTFAVAHAVATRGSRDYLRKLMGPDLVFVVINMTRECQKERLKERHGESVGDLMEKMFNLYEPAGEDEENAFNVTVDTGMSRQDVLKQVRDIAEGL